MRLRRLWHRFESSRAALPLLLLALFPSWLFAPPPALARYFSWPVVVFWMTPLTLLGYLLPLSCLAAWLLRRRLPERLVQRLVRVAALAVVPLLAAILYFYFANPLCAYE